MRQNVFTAKENVSIVLGVLAIVIAGAAGYVILSGNNPMTAKPDQQQVTAPNYSTQLKALKSQVDTLNAQISAISNNTVPALENVKSNISDMNNKLSDIGNMKSNLTNIQQKLAGIETQNNQVLYTPSAPAKVIMTLDRGSYFPGDSVHITALGADPLKAVQIELLDSNGNVVYNKLAWADSTGTVLYYLQLSTALSFGNYQVKLISDADTETNSIIVVSPAISYTFTANINKEIFTAGESILISGVATPSTLITGVMTGPMGQTYTSTATANVDGTYTLYFSTTPSFETGSWNIAVTNSGQTRSFSAYIQLGNTSGTYTFTAQTNTALYLAGQVIEVSGTAIPNSAVTAAFTSPSKTVYNDATTVNAYGSYIMTFSTSPSFETGDWSIDVLNLGQEKVLSATLESGSSYSFTAGTDKLVYLSGDLIEVTGSAQPSTSISATITSPSGKTFTSSTAANSAGSYFLFFSSGLSYEPGTWFVNVSNLGQNQVLTFTMQPGSSSLTTFTDKGIYTAGEVIQVSGTASPNSTVTASMTSPSGITYTANTQSNIYGSYSISFSTSQSYEIGNWHIITGNLGQSNIISIFIQSS